MENEEIKKINERFDELMEFLSENMATKADIANMATKDDIRELREELRNEISQVKFDLGREIGSVRAEVEELRREIEKLSKRTIEDANVTAQDILKLQKRMDALEQRLNQFQPAH